MGDLEGFKGMGMGRPVRLVAEDVDYLRKTIPEIGRIGEEYSHWSVKVSYKDVVLNKQVTGITPEFQHMRAHIPERGGRMINDKDMDLRRRVTFLGDRTKTELFGDSEAVGEQVLINGIPFTVVGVMKKKIQMNSYYGPDEQKLSIPATTFKAIFGHRYLNNIVYQPRHLDEMKTVERRLYETMGARYQFDPTDDRALSIWDTVESSRELNNILLGIKIFLGIIGFLPLLIAGVGVANIMYVSIKERTREIGIKMAVGARRGYILTQFLIEALIITFFGGFGGIVISYVLTEGFKRVPIESDVLEFMGRPTISWEIGAIVVGILGCMGLLSGLFPAMRAASISPVESLRYE